MMFFPKNLKLFSEEKVAGSATYKQSRQGVCLFSHDKKRVSLFGLFSHEDLSLKSFSKPHSAPLNLEIASQ